MSREQIGGRIVTDGLVLMLDAGDSTSYPGTGTTWTDLSGNGNNGTLVNGVGYDSGNGGSLTFDGSNDYVISTNGLDYNDSGGSFTVISFIYPTSVITSDIYEAILNRSDGSNHIFSTFISTTTGYLASWIFNSGGSIVQYTSNLTPLSNKWNMCVWSYSDLSGYTYTLINEGGSYTNSDLNSQTIRKDVTNEYTIGRWKNGGYNYSGHISNLVFYNRALTADEVLQNFNATRSRFGI